MGNDQHSVFNPHSRFTWFVTTVDILRWLEISGSYYRTHCFQSWGDKNPSFRTLIHADKETISWFTTTKERNGHHKSVPSIYKKKKKIRESVFQVEQNSQDLTQQDHVWKRNLLNFQFNSWVIKREMAEIDVSFYKITQSHVRCLLELQISTRPGTKTQQKLRSKLKIISFVWKSSRTDTTSVTFWVRCTCDISIRDD